MEFSVSKAVSIAMVGRFRSTRIVLFCAVVAILLPYTAGITCCMDDLCETTERCKPDQNICIIYRVLVPYRYECFWLPNVEFPTTCDGIPRNQNCYCSTDRCNVPGAPPAGGAAPPPPPPPGGAPGGAPGAAPLPAPPPPAPKSAANPMMLNIELLLAAAVIKLLKFVL